MSALPESTMHSFSLFLLFSALLIGSSTASLNCTVTGSPVPYYACPNASCPSVGQFNVGDIAWMWCAVDDMLPPNRWMFLQNDKYAPGLAERYTDCWFFEQKWNTTDTLPYCRNATFVPHPPPGPCVC
ncbi:hypothetical protein K469DRAFT_699414 [Zopfia rhizophila CBS 207.26]|uniref:Secreted protein n=1 Tax=Zopfia rhizophila CBS 207.26 TaxID=1314779 RepID=A0A6A6F0Y4_9PEZI|nr:hypothetical protein K469DRAFT_699414 [Zopfia rhizophila CBS 207.26]